MIMFEEKVLGQTGMAGHLSVLETKHVIKQKPKNNFL